MFISRLCSTIVLLTLFISSVFIGGMIGKICFSILAIAGVYLSVVEFSEMLKNKGMKSDPILTGLLLCLACLFVLWGGKEVMPNLIGIIVVFIIFSWILLLCSRNRIEMLQQIINSVAIFFMLGIPFIILSFLFVMDDTKKLFFYLVVGTKIGDIGAYAIGSLCNKLSKGKNHKLIPSISPGKSWEGLIGGLIISIVFSVFVFSWAAGVTVALWVPIVFGTVLFFGGAAGDLAESSLKRICEIKDSGKIIPGIGGVMDLVDSLLLNTPIFCFMYLLFVLYYR